MATLVHLVYIHGFQGNDTSFQSFPLHLQEALTAKVPSELNVRFQSSLYPTYKSTKPISFATKNFLSWLSTQPEGPVILVSHSMGGLLAADAATDPSNRDKDGRPKRIVGVIAFDVPFLGMHPHVVISGIASLFAKDEGKCAKTEREMNQHPQIQVVSAREAANPTNHSNSASDDWEKFKAKISARPRSQVIDDGSLGVPRSPSSLSSLSRSEPSSPQSSTLSATRRSPSPNFYDKAVGFISTHAKADDPVVRWLRKHADDPLSAGKRWIVERFQFGSCMFDPADLGIRYDNLQEWNGLWVNYWTYVGTPKDDEKKKGSDTPSHAPGEESLNEADELDNDIALLDSGICDTVTSKGKSSAAAGEGDKSKKKRTLLKKKRQESLEQSKSKPSLHHFIVLPTGLGKVLGGWEHWEKVPIAGVEDEVAAHTGLFIPEHNLDYANFVDRVADKVIGWCRQLYGQ